MIYQYRDISFLIVFILANNKFNLNELLKNYKCLN